MCAKGTQYRDQAGMFNAPNTFSMSSTGPNQIVFKFQVRQIAQHLCRPVEANLQVRMIDTIDRSRIHQSENFNFEIQESVWKRGFRVVESIKLTRGMKDFFQSFQSFETSVCCSICVQNVFSNGVLESHGEV